MVVSFENFDEVIANLSKHQVLSLDCETTGLEHFDLPFGYSVANATLDYWFDERVIPNLWERSKEFLETPRTWILQNIKFDMRMLFKKGIRIRGSLNELAAGARLVRNDHFGAKPYSLGAQASRYGMEKSKEADDYIKFADCYEMRKDFFGVPYKVPRYDQIPLDIISSYASKDARVTYDLWHIYISKLDDRELLLLQDEAKLTDICFDMEMRGLTLNKAYTLEAYYDSQEILTMLKDTYKRTTGHEYVNSAKSLQKVLEYKLPLTNKNNPSLTDEVIEKILVEGNEEDQKRAKLVQDIRVLDKKISTYYTSYLNYVWPDSTIKPFMYPVGTRTLRFSYGDPNLQNIPKEEDSVEKYVVRGCFVPKPGHVYVSFDYSQMEYKMTAAYANEAGVIRQIHEGADFHQAVADLVGMKRTEAKTLNFAILYGAGVDKIAAMLKVTKVAAERLKLKYFMGLPKVEKLIENIINTGKSRGYIVNWAGMKLYADRDFCYALPNHLIQSGGAQVVKKVMIKIAETFPDHKMVLQVHDQLVFEFLPEDLVRVPVIKDIMENIFPPLNGVKLTVDVSMSHTSLAERDMHDYE